MKSVLFLALLLLAGCLATPASEDPADLAWRTIEVTTQDDTGEGGLRHFRLTALGPSDVRFGGVVILPSYSNREGCLLVGALPHLAENLVPQDPGALQDAWTTFGESSVEAGVAGQGPFAIHGPVLGGVNIAGGSSGRRWSLAAGDHVDVWLGGPDGLAQLGFGVANVTSQGPILWEELPRTAVRCGIGIGQAEERSGFARHGDTEVGVGGRIALDTANATTLYFDPSTSDGLREGELSFRGSTIPITDVSILTSRQPGGIVWEITRWQESSQGTRWLMADAYWPIPPFLDLTMT